LGTGVRVRVRARVRARARARARARVRVRVRVRVSPAPRENVADAHCTNDQPRVVRRLDEPRDHLARARAG
jgi:hypothetical protein